MPGDAICSQTAYYRRNASQSTILDPDFWGSGSRATLTTAAQNMNMGVNKSWQNHKPRAIDLFDLQPFDFNLTWLLDSSYFFISY
jgi:hypothetical protein